ncbi:hypothetical protein JTE90_010218 [Oedothorax gibbosus]|uniref:Uncharacterized protein n=1 Tax=Oedothorax gibbosus TaxID=931172 RepID=A0AAV6UJ74_9ARAC|nr:hypothetical protein JTE90_010218 [Oedothorax gibbosus]
MCCPNRGGALTRSAKRPSRDYSKTARSSAARKQQLLRGDVMCEATPGGRKDSETVRLQSCDEGKITCSSFSTGGNGSYSVSSLTAASAVHVRPPRIEGTPYIREKSMHRRQPLLTPMFHASSFSPRLRKNGCWMKTKTLSLWAPLAPVAVGWGGPTPHGRVSNPQPFESCSIRCVATTPDHLLAWIRMGKKLV